MTATDKVLLTYFTYKNEIQSFYCVLLMKYIVVSMNTENNTVLHIYILLTKYKSKCIGCY